MLKEFYDQNFCRDFPEARVIDGDFRDYHIRKLYLEDIGQTKVIEDESAFKGLIKKAKLGDQEARRIVIESNTRLVVDIAFKFFCPPLIDPNDLIQSGNIGLINAVDGFDPNLNYRFSTYAAKAIRNAMLVEYVSMGNALHLPAHLGGWINQYLEAERVLKEDNKREATQVEIEEYLGWSADKVERIFRAVTSTNYTYLSEDVTDLEGVDAGDLIADEHVELEAEVIENGIPAEVEFMLSFLNKRLRRVVELRFALGENGQFKEVRKLDEIARILAQDEGGVCLSTERIRQLEGVALRRVRYINLLVREKPEIFDKLSPQVVSRLSEKEKLELGLKIVAERFKIEVNDLKDKRRDDIYPLLRQTIAYLWQNRLNLIDIARVMNRDHATIDHGIKNIEKLISSDPFANLVYSTIKRDCHLLLTG